MATKESEDILERLLFRATGTAVLAALQVVGLALLVVAEKNIPKSAMLVVIGAQILVLICVVLAARKSLHVKEKAISLLISRGPKVKEVEVVVEKKSESEVIELTDEDIMTLQGLAEKPDGTYVIHLAHEIGLSRTRTDHSVDRLLEVEYVVKSSNGAPGINAGPEFRVTREGKKYLISNGHA